MPELLAAALGALPCLLLLLADRRAHTAALSAERARVNELYHLLQAQAAPVEYAAQNYASPTVTDWIHDETGLISYPADPEDE